MRFLLSSFLILVFSASVLGQKKLDKALERWNNKSVPYVYVDDLKLTENIVLLDTRKKEEFEVSHLKNAIWVGHEEFTEERVTTKILDKNAPIIVYCSIGVRSEDIGERLQKAGYTNIKNLYGGIFEWKNHGNAVYSPKQMETDSVHAFDKEWGKLLKKGVKVY
ncbi:MAG: rhodanese-like domain-containing protein [Maribacter sp.]|uniref:rhodanese-like domain-containing protein n=1 Tax=Maribacter sp. TaxID=1897614 RepID=UPI0032993B8B